jgi:hypothetical protein
MFNVLFVGYSLAKNNLNSTYQYNMIPKKTSKTKNYLKFKVSRTHQTDVRKNGRKTKGRNFKNGRKNKRSNCKMSKLLLIEMQNVERKNVEKENIKSKDRKQKKQYNITRT